MCMAFLLNIVCIWGLLSSERTVSMFTGRGLQNQHWNKKIVDMAEETMTEATGSAFSSKFAYHSYIVQNYVDKSVV